MTPVGRRSRQRDRETPSRAPGPSGDRMARVRVPAETWAEFRALAGIRPVAAVLGELVTRAVDGYRARRLRERQLTSGSCSTRWIVRANSRQTWPQSQTGWNASEQTLHPGSAPQPCYAARAPQQRETHTASVNGKGAAAQRSSFRGL